MKEEKIKVVVAVTRPEYEKGRDEFDRIMDEGLFCVPAPPGEKELASAVRNQKARHVICGVEQYRGRLYEALPSGGVIARFGVGFDNINLAKAREHGLLCTNTPGVLDESVAEHVFALILASARNITVLDNSTRSGLWLRKTGIELSGKVLAVIGAGSIGSRVSRIASIGFGMTVIGCEIKEVDWEEKKRLYGFQKLVRDFGEASENADFVSLHLPSGISTRRFMNHERLNQMNRRAWLINTSRGVIIDESALFDALSDHRIAGAALDVFAAEPYVPSDPAKDLRALPNVIMTPHVASNTRDANMRMAKRALKNIILAERGEFEQMDLLNETPTANDE
jgi:phosphoglycerate dehydrogenase-like enzyme